MTIISSIYSETSLISLPQELCVNFNTWKLQAKNPWTPTT
uniref:Uncharacterized protein n=1 Tax=Rhizophora mucronata TaxID=61149 RepID=A0A2P2P1L5_RHIMU